MKRAVIHETQKTMYTQYAIRTKYPILFIMVALHGRCGHYNFGLWFLSFFFFLDKSQAEWMSTILLHMVWP